MVPPRRTRSIASCSAASRSTPVCSISFSATRSGSSAGQRLGELRAARAVGLHADGVDHRVRAPAAGAARRTASLTSCGRRRTSRRSSTSAPWRAGPLEPLRYEVDADHPSMRRGGVATRQAIEPIGPRPSTTTVPPSGDAGVLHGLPRGRQHVGQVDEPVVGRPVGHLDRARTGPAARAAARPGRRAPGRTAWCSRTARRPCRTRAPASSRTATAARASHMTQWPQEMLNGITTRSPGAMWVTSPPTASTMPIGSWPRMSPSRHERRHHLVQVQVRAAQPGRRDPDDRIGRLLDRRIRDRVHPDVALAVPHRCSHAGPPGSDGPLPLARFARTAIDYTRAGQRQLITRVRPRASAPVSESRTVCRRRLNRRTVELTPAGVESTRPHASNMAVAQPNALATVSMPR